ncbi:MAG: DUF6691 family protein [Bdellovibrionota bacterium]
MRHCIHGLQKKITHFRGSVSHIPTKTELHPTLFLGAALFGIGWGLGGFVPGLAL